MSSALLGRIGSHADDVLRLLNEAFDNRPLPTQPPYTAFIGNIWGDDVNESGLAAIFSSLKVKSVKVIRDRDGKSRGFGFVEFEDKASLKAALRQTWQYSLCGRLIRVRIADPRKCFNEEMHLDTFQ
ncbi:hypothetical protein EDD16DRAFT_1591935 [Pisolithus croceorrhizus]|nr:hypothetical protein EDD16DRAFT_1591935 [Pisolithus croceorrhizus]KAI6142549.1 hypothetical protein EDD17DRAFT_1661596 [Pisolithus thermaeus]